jgi:hypothetical protein
MSQEVAWTFHPNDIARLRESIASQIEAVRYAVCS